MMMTDGWTEGWMGCVKIWFFFGGFWFSWRWVDTCILGPLSRGCRRGLGIR